MPWEGVCAREREGVCVCERGYVCERERWCVFVREGVCVFERGSLEADEVTVETQAESTFDSPRRDSDQA